MCCLLLRRAGWGGRPSPGSARPPVVRSPPLTVPAVAERRVPVVICEGAPLGTLSVEDLREVLVQVRRDLWTPSGSSSPARSPALSTARSARP